jgi:WD40 repeat protein
MEHVLKGRGIDTCEQREQHTADVEGEKVTIIDLEQRDPPGESKHSWLTSHLLRWQRAPHRRRWRLTGTVSFLLLLLVLLSVSNLSPASLIESFRRAYAPQARPSGSALAVLPQRDGITCLRDAMWSPKSRLIAVLGYSQTCSSVTYVPGLVNLYEARTSQLLRQLHPDEAIVQALKAASGSAGEPSARVPQQKQGGGSGLVISYQHVVWSPDTQRLAFTFHLAASSPSLDGIVLMNKEGTQTQVVLDQQNPFAPSSAEWDLERRRLITSNVFPFSPASAYHWGPKATVIPGRLLPTQFLPAAPPLSPIGNPDGDASFTLWQPALAQVTSSTDPSGIYRIHSWSTSFAAWSPDGRYLINDLNFWGLLTSPKVISAGMQVFQGSDPARDRNKRGAQGLTNQCAAQLQAVKTTTAFAWSPNGRVLADYGAGKRVDLSDCTTGHKFASFPLQSQYTAPSAEAVALRWSPDGSHLLLSSVASGLVSLWKVDPPLRGGRTWG